jgi:tetratricopeptide (TPR) repeat protein
VGFKEGAAGIQLPNRQAVTDAVSASVQAYVEREIFPQVEELEKKLAETQGSVRYRNKLAVVYARYGLYDKALKNFEQVLSRREYSPALTNVANIHFIRQNFSKALEFYNRALARNEGNTAALVGVARCNHEMENYGLVKQTYAKIRDLDPAAAERFAYLDMQGDTDARASAAAELKTTVLWDDEEE